MKLFNNKEIRLIVTINAFFWYHSNRFKEFRTERKVAETVSSLRKWNEEKRKIERENDGYRSKKSRANR